MSDYLEVKGYPGLVRDPNSNAVLNVDYKKIELIKAQKLARQAKRQKEIELEGRLNSIESDVKDIKDMLISLSKSYK